MINQQTLIGRIGRDAELRFTAGGTPVAQFSVATDKTWTKDGEKKSETTWHDVTVWGKHAETIVSMLTKGKLVFVQGETRKVKFTPSKGENAGREVEKTEITAETVKILTPKNAAPGYEPPADSFRHEERAERSGRPASTTPPARPVADEDLPF